MEDLKLEDDFVGDSVPLAFGVGPLPDILLNRALGYQRGAPKNRLPQPSGVDEVAEERLISRSEFAVTPCKLANQNQPPPILGHVGGHHVTSASTRSTFLMVFSPDKELVASTHGDHNIYISNIKDGSCVKVLQGHPRTPWCVAFHPSHKGVVASGCLGGHVRVWDLHGGSELWVTDGVIASLAFHPTDRLLVVATYNELHFWDWEKPKPFTKVKTKNDKEKVRYVQFDALGHQLITGIANLSQQYQQQQQQQQQQEQQDQQQHHSAENQANPSPQHAPSSLLGYMTTNNGGTYEERRSRIMDRYERIMQQYNNALFNDSEGIRIFRGRNPMLSFNPRGPDTVTSEVAVDLRTHTGRSPPFASSSSSSSPTSGPRTSVLPEPDRVSSFSQTLSALAQAATNQLMAENSAAAAIDAMISHNRPTNSRVSSRERDSSLGHDHSYDGGRTSRTQPSSQQFQQQEWSQTIPSSLDSSNVGPPRARNRHELDHSYYRQQLRDRMLELSRYSDNIARRMDSIYNDHLNEDLGVPRIPTSFSHSPESEFVEVARRHPASRISSTGSSVRPGDTEIYVNPNRSSSRGQRERRRLWELIERRESLVSRIEQLRSARELLAPPENIAISSSSSPSATPLVTPEATPSSQDIVDGIITPPLSSTNTDHTYGLRSIDDWAANRRQRLRRLQTMRSSGRSSTETSSQAQVTTPSTAVSAASTSTSDQPSSSAAATSTSASSLAAAGPSNSSLATAASSSSTSMSTETPTSSETRRRALPCRRRSSVTAEINPNILNEQDVEAITESIATSPQPGPSNPRRRPPINRENLDMVLLSRHIDHMQQICRASLSDMAVRRERRQIVRLQGIRTQLGALQRQIRSLRAMSFEELRNRTRDNSMNQSSEPTSASRSSSRSRNSEILGRRGSQASSSSGRRRSHQQPAETVTSEAQAERQREVAHMQAQRATAALMKLRKRNRSRASAVPSQPSSSNVVTRQRGSRGKMSRTHNQLVSQLRATLRAIEMSPDLARQKNSKLIRTKVEASQVVMEQTEANCGKPTEEHNGSSTRNELRALSQRLERMLRERREAEAETRETETSRSSAIFSMANQGDLSGVDPNLEHDALGDPWRPWSSSRLGPDAGRWGRRSHQRRFGRPARDSRSRSREDSLFYDTTSESDSESSDLSGGLQDLLQVNGPPSVVTRAGRWTRYDFPTPPSQDVAGPSSTSNASTSRRASDSPRESWRASIRERLDIRAGLRRDAERERRRLNRERNLLWRRRRFERYLGDLDVLAYPARDFDTSSSFLNPDGGNDLGSSVRLPPLRELIWRRINRRNAQLSLLEDELGAEAGQQSPTSSHRDRSRHREMLSWMVDQLSIDQQQQQLQQQQHQQQQQTQQQQQQPQSHGHSGPRLRRFHIHTPDGASAQSGTGTARNAGPQDQQEAGAGFRRRGPPRDFEAAFYPFQRESFFLYHTPCNMSLTHRIQAWDFVKGDIPDISDQTANVVVKEAKIHNDASVDISKDGTILVTLVPSNLPMTTVVGVYSLSKHNRGTCYATSSLESSAVSVSLSPTTRHLLVGLTSRAGRIALSPAERGLMAQVFRIKMPWEFKGERGRLVHRRDIPQSEHGQTAINCIRWIPVAGQGVVYATNTGLLKILR